MHAPAPLLLLLAASLAVGASTGPSNAEAASTHAECGAWKAYRTVVHSGKVSYYQQRWCVTYGGGRPLWGDYRYRVLTGLK